MSSYTELSYDGDWNGIWNKANNADNTSQSYETIPFAYETIFKPQREEHKRINHETIFSTLYSSLRLSTPSVTGYDASRVQTIKLIIQNEFHEQELYRLYNDRISLFSDSGEDRRETGRGNGVWGLGDEFIVLLDNGTVDADKLLKLINANLTTESIVADAITGLQGSIDDVISFFNSNTIKTGNGRPALDEVNLKLTFENTEFTAAALKADLDSLSPYDLYSGNNKPYTTGQIDASAVTKITATGEAESPTRELHRLFNTDDIIGNSNTQVVINEPTSVESLNNLDAKTKLIGRLVANVKKTDIATLKTLTNINNNNSYTVNINDSSIDVNDLNTIANLSGIAVVDASSVTTLSGSITDIKKAYNSTSITGLDTVAIDLSGESISAIDLNDLDNKTNKKITATVKETDIATLKLLKNQNNNNNYAITIDNSLVEANDLNTVVNKTSAVVDASSVTTLSGSITDIKNTYDSNSITGLLESGFSQIGEDLNGDALNKSLGHSVSLSSDGSVLAIGANFNDGNNGTDSGLVRIFKNIGNKWTQIGSDIEGEAPNDQSGYSLSLSSDGSVVAIGSPYNGKPQEVSSLGFPIWTGNYEKGGHVRVFKNVDNKWTQFGNDIIGSKFNDQFGYQVSLSGDGSVVGAKNKTGDVSIYKLSPYSDWNKIGTTIQENNYSSLTNKTASSVSLSYDGSIVAIGSPSSSSVRVFKNLDDNWSQQGGDIGINLEGINAHDRTGFSVSLSSDGSIVAIGSPYHSEWNQDEYRRHERVGTVRIFKLLENSLRQYWMQVGSDIDGKAPYHQSGSSVSLSSDGSVVAIGSPNTSTGTIRVFENVDENWTQVLTDIDGLASGGRSGTSVSLSGDGSAVAISTPMTTGSVRVFDTNQRSSVAVKLTDNDLSASELSTLALTARTIDASAVRKIIGTKDNINKAYALTGITGLGDEVVKLSNTSISASDLNALNKYTTNKIDATSISELTGSESELQKSYRNNKFKNLLPKDNNNNGLVDYVKHKKIFSVF